MIPPPLSPSTFQINGCGSLSLSVSLCVSLSLSLPPPHPLHLSDVLDPNAQLFILIHGHSDLVRPVHISVLVTPQPIRNFSCDVVGNQWQYIIITLIFITRVILHVYIFFVFVVVVAMKRVRYFIVAVKNLVPYGNLLESSFSREAISHVVAVTS